MRGVGGGRATGGRHTGLFAHLSLLVGREDVQQGFGHVRLEPAAGQRPLGGGPRQRHVGGTDVGGEALELSQVLGHGTRIAARDRAGEGSVTRTQGVVEGRGHQRPSTRDGASTPAARSACNDWAIRVTRWLAPWARAAW